MTNWDTLLDAAQGGTLPAMFPAEMVIPMFAPADIGRAAADLLLSPPGDASITYVEGLARYSAGDAARAFARALGRPVLIGDAARTLDRSLPVPGFRRPPRGLMHG